MSQEKQDDRDEDREDGQEKGSPDRSKADQSRRGFLKLSLVAGLALAVGGIASVVRSLFSPGVPEPAPGTTTTQTSSGASTGTFTSGTNGGSGFPRIKVANVSDLSGGQTVTFNYPLQNTPNLLAKLGVKAEGGVGPDGDIVGFSQICQHLGCIWGYVPTSSSPKCDSSFKASEPVAYCCCHGSIYDLTKGAEVIGGPSPRPQPQVTLEFDSATGDIYAVGMGPPTVFGHHTGSQDVDYDLQGGTAVS